MVSTESGVTLHSMIWRWTPFSALALCPFSTTWADTSKLLSSSSHVTWGSTSHTRNSEMSPCHARAWNYTFGSLSQPDFIIPTLFQYIIMCHQLSLLSFINISLLYSFLSVVIALHLFRSWAHPFWAALAVVIEIQLLSGTEKHNQVSWISPGLSSG